MNILSNENMFNTFCEENQMIKIISQFVEAVYSKEQTTLNNLHNEHSFLKGLSVTKGKKNKNVWEVDLEDVIDPTNQLNLFSVGGNINNKNIEIKSVYFYQELINHMGHSSLKFDKVDNDIKIELFLCDPRTGNNLSVEYEKDKRKFDIIMYNKDSEFNLFYKVIAFLKANIENFENDFVDYITQGKPLNISQEKKDTFLLIHDINIDDSVYLTEIQNNIFKLKEDYKSQPRRNPFLA